MLRAGGADLLESLYALRIVLLPLPLYLLHLEHTLLHREVGRVPAASAEVLVCVNSATRGCKKGQAKEAPGGKGVSP